MIPLPVVVPSPLHPTASSQPLHLVWQCHPLHSQMHSQTSLHIQVSPPCQMCRVSLIHPSLLSYLTNPCSAGQPPFQPEAQTYCRWDFTCDVHQSLRGAGQPRIQPDVRMFCCWELTHGVCQSLRSHMKLSLLVLVCFWSCTSK